MKNKNKQGFMHMQDFSKSAKWLFIGDFRYIFPYLCGTFRQFQNLLIGKITKKIGFCKENPAKNAYFLKNFDFCIVL